MIISTGLPSAVVEDKKFAEMVVAIKGIADHPVSVPSLQITRQLIQRRYEINKSKIKQILKSQDRISFSIHVCNPVHDPKDSLLIVTAFYIDKTWNIKDMIIGFHSLPRLVDSSGKLLDE